jgi:hypothetical protein
MTSVMGWFKKTAKEKAAKALDENNPGAASAELMDYRRAVVRLNDYLIERNVRLSKLNELIGLIDTTWKEIGKAEFTLAREYMARIQGWHIGVKMEAEQLHVPKELLEKIENDLE